MKPLSARSFLRRFLIAFVLVVVITSAAIAGAYAQADRKVKAVAVAAIDPSVLESGGNFLLIGSDTRAFVDNAKDAQHFGNKNVETGQRSDTIMVAHVDPDKGTAYLVSFPRDLWVEIPGIGHAKINAAFNAGPQRVIETIEREFDVPISHYLEVDFSGFRKIVNAIGSIPIYFPTPARDVKSGLSVTRAGCQHLNGDQALAFVRSRYYESFKNGQWQTDPLSDLSRIQRQQYFLRTLAQQTLHAAEHSPWRANSIGDAVLANLVRDPKLTFSSLRGLAYAFHQPGNVQTLTLPTHRQFFNGQDALALDDTKAAPILARLRANGTPKSTPRAPSGVSPSSVRVAVQNGSGRNGLGSAALNTLRTLGYSVLPPAENADRSDYAVTEVRYAPGAQTKGQYLLAGLGGAGKLVALGTGKDGGADVVLVLGRDYTGVTASPTSAPASTAPPKATSAPSKATTPTTAQPVGC